MGSPSKTSGSLGGRPLGASPRRLGLHCRPLAVRQQDNSRLVFAGGYKSDSARCIRYCHVSEMPTLGSRDGLDTCRTRERRGHDHRPNDWNWAVRFHAAKPHGLGRPHPGVPPNHYYRCASDSRGWSGGYQKVARRRSVGTRSSFNSSLVVVRCIRFNGRVRNCLDTDYVSYRPSES